MMPGHYPPPPGGSYPFVPPPAQPPNYTPFAPQMPPGLGLAAPPIGMHPMAASPLGGPSLGGPPPGMGLPGLGPGLGVGVGGAGLGGPGPGFLPPSGIDPRTLAAMLLANQANAQPGAGAVNEEKKEETAAPAWKEFKTAEGRIFWHCTKTNKSTWDKPDELRSDEEKVLSTATPWREYPEGDGKTYWHNLKTKESEWEMPAEVTQIRQTIADLEAEDWSGLKFDGKTSTKLKFKEFLSRRGVGCLSPKWEEISEILKKDPKWKVFDNQLTNGERKHCFNEYVTHLQRKQREDQRLEKAAAKDHMLEFLNRWRRGEDRPAMSPVVTYKDFEQLARNELWWKKLETKDRVDAFEETANAVATEVQQKPSKETAAQILEFLGDCVDEFLPIEAEPDDVINFTRKYFESAHVLPADVYILNLWERAIVSNFDREARAEERRLMTHEMTVRAAFVQLLRDAEEAGLLNAKSEWVDFITGPCPKTLPVDDVDGDVPGDALSVQGDAVSVDSGFREEDLKMLKRVQRRVHLWMAEDQKREKQRREGDSKHGDGDSRQGGAQTRRGEEKQGDARHAESKGDVDMKDSKEIDEDAKNRKDPNENGAKESRPEENRDLAGQSKGDREVSTEGTDAEKRVCEDMRYLKLFLQGGSTARDLFDDLVFSLWDSYEALRSGLKEKLSEDLTRRLLSDPLPSASEFREILHADERYASLLPIMETADRPGVLNPLIVSLAKRLRRSSSNY